MIDADRMEEMALAIIASAGEAKGFAYNAVNQAKEGDFAGAEESLKEVERAEHTAHDAHHDLLILEADGELPPLGVLTTHAQDHFMAGLLVQELCTEIVALYREVHTLKEKLAKIEGGN